MHAYHIWQLTDHTAVIAQHGPRLQTIRKHTVLCVTEHALYKGKHTLRRSRCARHGEHHAYTMRAPLHHAGGDLHTVRYPQEEWVETRNFLEIYRSGNFTQNPPKFHEVSFETFGHPNLK